MGRKAGANATGLDFENLVARQLRAVFDDAVRLGSDKHSDVAAGPMLIECKNEKDPPRIRGAFAQACGDMKHYPDLSIPAAVCKTKGHPKDALVTMRFDDLLQLLTDARDGKREW